MSNLKGSATRITSRTQYLPYGIHSKLYIQDVEVNPSYLDVVVSDESNRIFRDRIFIPNLEAEWIKSDPNIKERELERFSDRLAQYLLLYYSVGEIPDTEKMTLEQILNITYDLLKKSIKDKVYFNIKLVRDAKNPSFAKAPRYAPYIEKWEEGKTPTLTFTKWELDNLINIKTNNSGSITDSNETTDEITLF